MSGRVVRIQAERADVSAAAREVRALSPPPPEVEDDVREIMAAVRERGDAAVRELTARFDRVEVPTERLRVSRAEIDAAVSVLDPALREALDEAIANVRAVARAGLEEDRAVELPAGQTVEVLELPVRSAAAYVPGGRAPYPSTVVMCAVTAREAGVERLAVCAPPGRDGEAHATIVAACGLCGVDEVYRLGGAQAIAALAHGTKSVPPVDVIVGPGSPYVQEAKRQAVGMVGIDGVAGPSELVIVASPDADPELIALDLLAQGEHGPDSLVAAVSHEASLLDAVEAVVDAAGGTVAPLALVAAPDDRTALAVADAIAPEHLQLMGTAVEELAAEVRTAGAVFIGHGGATAFGDYVAGSNHVLPTGGAARYSSALSVATFRRRMSRVTVPPEAARRLGPSGAAIARAEGFWRHAESMSRRGEDRRRGSTEVA